MTWHFQHFIAYICFPPIRTQNFASCDFLRSKSLVVCIS
uniref:Uncharacterized protein n=1 Tax=Rhizophora mucronata TaxID=61149 RepID=A0A2P2IL06_RHIMU